MPRTSLAAAGAAVTAVLALAACGSASAATSASARPATAGAIHAVSPAGTIPGCRTGVWAENYTDAGTLAWRVSLPVPKPYNDGQPLSPVVVGGIAVFADGNALYARRLSDGHGMWHKAFPNKSNTLTAGITGTVDGLWAWKGTVVALLGENSATPSLVSLDAAAGAVRYRVKLDSQELRDLVVTSSGVAAVLTLGDTVKTFDLSTGKALWSRTYRKDAGVLADGSLLIIDAKPTDESPTTLHGVVARTGHTRWTRTGLPNFFAEQIAPTGTILGYGVSLPKPPPQKQQIFPVLALSVTTGKTLWTLHTANQVTAVWPSAAGVAIAIGIPGRVLAQDPTARLTFASLTTGKVRWSVTGTHSDPETVPVITGSDVISVATTPATGTVVDRNAATGAVRWKAAITPTYGRFLAQPSGQNVLAIFPGATATKPSRLLAINRATGKTVATILLPGMTTVGAAPAVAGSDVLFQPQTLSCQQPVHPGPGGSGTAPAAGHV